MKLALREFADATPLVLEKGVGSSQVVPAVTVIIPVHNTVHFLRDSVESALNSKGVDVSVLLVDDASVDGSYELGKILSDQYEEVSLVRNRKQLGAYFCRNAGIMQADTEFIAFLDSDDIQDPYRLLKQITPLLHYSLLSATYCNGARWSTDLRFKISDERLCHISCVFRKSLISDIGFFDSVNFSGDAEFRDRIIRVFGRQRVATIQEDLYKIRFRKHSLTSSGESAKYSVGEDGLIKQNMNPARRQYMQNYSAWHDSGQRLYMPFPLRYRPFPLGSAKQCASPFLGQKISGHMASFPDREQSLPLAIASIATQVDELHLFLNNGMVLPDLSHYPNITIHRSSEDLKDVGKYASMNNVVGYLVVIDDDILYPPDYVSRLLVEVELLNREAVVGVHGIRYSRTEPHPHENRIVSHFTSAASGFWADALGAGTIGFHSDTITFSREDFPTGGVGDISVASKCLGAGVPLWCLARQSGWLNEIETPVESRLFNTKRNNPSLADEVLGSFNKRLLPKLTANALSLGSRRDPQDFHLIVTGRNCEEFAADCLDSIEQAMLQLGREISITIVDDCSTDGTRDIVLAHSLAPALKLISSNDQKGAAWSRHIAMLTEESRDSVIVLIDLDDLVHPLALKRVADIYDGNSTVKATFGNWVDEIGNRNPHDFYSPKEIDEGSVRGVRPFKGTHLRTFKRALYDAIPEDRFIGPDGEWLKFCTDAALVFPLLDQCHSGEVRWIEDPIYTYRRKRNGNSTKDLTRSQGLNKLDILDFISSKPPIFFSLGTSRGVQPGVRLEGLEPPSIFSKSVKLFGQNLFSILLSGKTALKTTGSFILAKFRERR